jgi:hypothetical protein
MHPAVGILLNKKLQKQEGYPSRLRISQCPQCNISIALAVKYGELKESQDSWFSAAYMRKPQRLNYGKRCATRQ